MSERDYALGERVVAALGGSGFPRRGVVTARLGGVVSDWLWNGEYRYMVRFDGDNGITGPCVVYRAEGEREAASPEMGTAA